MTPGDSPFQVDAFLSRFEGMEDVALQVVANFCEELPRMLAAVEGSIADGDLRRLEIAAHTLKGALATLNVDSAREQAFVLEQAGRGRTPASAIPGALDSLRAELARLEPALTGWLRERKSA